MRDTLSMLAASVWAEVRRSWPGLLCIAVIAVWCICAAVRVAREYGVRP